MPPAAGARRVYTLFHAARVIEPRYFAMPVLDAADLTTIRPPRTPE